MVKKLFKHEFLSYARVMGLVYGILLTVAVATKLIYTFDSDTLAYQIIKVFTNLIYWGGVAFAIGFSFAMGIIRFYRNLFTAEGYLSFTLPVTAGQHIVVKAVTAVTMNAITLIVVALSFVIVMLGDALTEFCTGMGVFLEQMYGQLGADGVFFTIEAVIALVVFSFTGILLYYGCISIGQMAKKNRILAAVGVYFAYYILTQIVSTIITVVIATTASSYEVMPLLNWIALHPMETIHIAFCVSIVLGVIFLLVEYLIIRYIMTKKLNLE